MKIPKKIIIFWHDQQAIPDEIASAIAATQAAHSGFETVMLDDTVAADLIAEHMPQFSALYRKIRVPAARADIARLVALHKFGGLYIDASMGFHTSVEDCIGARDELVLVRRDDTHRFRAIPDKAGVINGIIGAVAGSDFILGCLKKIYFNLATGLHNFTVQVATGPVVINEILRQNPEWGGVGYLSFSRLMAEFFRYNHVAGVNNNWVIQQLDGIVDPVEYGEIRIVADMWPKVAEDQA